MAGTASGPDTSASAVARLWARMLCGLAVIVGLFPALRTRLLNHLCNMSSGPNTDRNASNADAPTKGYAGRVVASSKSSKSTGKSGAKTKAQSEQGRSKGKGRGKNGDGQAGQRSNNKPRGGKRKGKGKNKTVDNSNADDATPKGMV